MKKKVGVVLNLMLWVMNNILKVVGAKLDVCGGRRNPMLKVGGK